MHQSNLTDSSDIEALFAEVLAKHGKIDKVMSETGNLMGKHFNQLSQKERDQMLAYISFVDNQGQDYAKRLGEELKKQRQ